jgi:hypothetical protein
MGGLGNQLFTVIAGYITSKVNNVPLYIFNMQSSHQTKTADYKNTIFSNIGIHIDSEQDKLDIPTFNNPGFSPWEPSMVPNGRRMDSYFQYYPAILPYETEVRNLVLQGLSKERGVVARLVEGLEDVAFLHVRRGDYMGVSHIHYVQTIDYYSRALGLIDAKSIIVISDDIDWVRQQELFKGGRFIIVDGLNELETLALMSLCKSAVCSNSTFSWWGAFLGAHGCRGKVMVPERWINTQIFNTEHWPLSPRGVKVPPLFPEEWIILP